MRTLRLLTLLVTAGLLVTGVVAPADATLDSTSKVVAIRTRHVGNHDRIVFVFKGGLPAERAVRYSDQLRSQGSGLPIPVPGQALLTVRFFAARHHAVGQGGSRALALPNLMTWYTQGDFEAVLVYGIGLAKRAPVHMFVRHNPARVIVDIGAAFRTVDRKVHFFNRHRFAQNREPFFTPRQRPVRPQAPATGVMDRLFAGPLVGEKHHGLSLVTSDATGYRHLRIKGGIARVRLTGGCNAHGSTVSIAGEIIPTLKQFASVDWVKIYGPKGHTPEPTGPGDSVPGCLNP